MTRSAAPPADLPTLETHPQLSRAALGALGRDVLAPYLAARRWFGAKGQHIDAADFDEVAPLAAGAEPLALTRLRVRFASGRTEHYQLPLALDHHGADHPPVLARLPDGGALRDAVDSAAFRQQLGRGFADRRIVPAQAHRWEFEPLTDLGAMASAPSRVLGGEQSNTSIVFGDALIMKLFRRLEPGPNPDVEIGRFLATRTDFRGTPALLGVLHLRGPDGDAIAGMVQQFMPGSTDAWAHVLAQLQRHRHDDTWTHELQSLGHLTRDLHRALASDPTDPDFAPEPTQDLDLARWRHDIDLQISDTLAQLAAHLDRLPADLAASARLLLAREDPLRALVRRDLRPDAVGPRTRHHGDYHLGQVLRTRDGDWRIIDFEGEPARPLDERRAKHHPLRDVAGMLRSFAYAAAVAAQTDPSLDPAARERAMRGAFLRGYDPALERDPQRAALLALFEAEKTFYELRYELGSRPDWAWIPLAGLDNLLSKTLA